VLAFGGAVADFALAADAKGVLQGMVRLALVESDLGEALHVGIKQPFRDEERALDTSDFAQCLGQLVLARLSHHQPPARGPWHRRAARRRGHLASPRRRWGDAARWCRARRRQ
jgi:hypothetical protein